MTTRQFPHKAHRVGRLFVTTVRQAAGAPVIDLATTHGEEGWRAPSLAIRIPRTVGTALVVGWVTPKHLRHPRFLYRIPLLGRLFRPRF